MSTKIRASMNSKPNTTGLRYWMARVPEECRKVSVNFSADPVHDLRVALRRCRSMADGMMAMDPDPNWKAMKKAGRALFQSLGALRDVQIMIEWIEKLELPPGNRPYEAVTVGAVQSTTEVPEDPVSALLRILEEREAELKRDARVPLEQFHFKQWKQWTKILPARAARIRPGSTVFKHLALERWMAARQLHTVALRNRSQVAFHTLRIGIKRFRYIVENFLPAEHAKWGNDLKHLQDLLGEVHDLDVLWATAITSGVLPDDDTRRTWHERIMAARTKRIDEYRERTTGPGSLWNQWRAELPQSKQIQQIATQRMKLWAKVLDPDFAHSERVARLALELYDGLMGIPTFAKAIQGGSENGSSPREVLYAAALLHDVGKAKGNKGHHKESRELIQKHGTPLGWEEGVMRRASVVARFHCGVVPTRNHGALRDLPPEEQKMIIGLSAVLRLANAFDCAHDGHVRRIWREAAGPDKKPRTNGSLRKTGLGRNEALVLVADGYNTMSSTARTVAAERFLLENILRRPILVRAAKFN